MKPALFLHPLDLRLPLDKTPDSVSSVTGTPSSVEACIRNYAVGSSCEKSLVYETERGMFGCVYESWKNHWNLRTSPEDWWMPIATKKLPRQSTRQPNMKTDTTVRARKR
eukprot:scaffold2120_cov169-Amphora_coffeaeformis.AAC.6